MQNYIIIIFCFHLFTPSFGVAQSENLETVNNNAAVIKNVKTERGNNVVYRLFPTKNMWTFIKLNTRNGKMWQVQYTVNDKNRFETYLNTISLIAKDNEENGRFTLYPTQNTYNFILVDQIDGRLWQAQWSIKSENRGIIPIN